MVDSIDHEALAISRLITQYKESVNIINYIKTLLIEANNLEEVFQELLTERYLDTAIGVQLDILGEIVGQSRNIKDANILKYFGFRDGGQHIGGFGYKFFVSGDHLFSNLELEDDPYRLLIKARIKRNGFDGTIESFIEFMTFAFTVDFVGVTELENATASIVIGKTLSDQERALIVSSDENNFVPKPAGVRFNYFDAPVAGVFGFADNPLTDFVKGFNVGQFVHVIN